MAAGTALRNAARNIVNLLGNTVTVTEYTHTYNERGASSAVFVASSSITVATTNNNLPKQLKLDVGDMQVGDLKIYVKDQDVITKNHIVTFNSVDYRIDELKPIYVEDILVLTVGACYKNHS